MKVVVDLAVCESNGQCEICAPQVFRLEADGTLVYDDEPDDAFRSDVEEAVGSCPTGAIRIAEE
jgi:ferredoxin